MTHHMFLNLTCTESAVEPAILSRDTSHVSKSESCDCSAADRPLLRVCACAGSLPDFPLLRLVIDINISYLGIDSFPQILK